MLWDITKCIQDRITSYNVCYTKLLRNSDSDLCLYDLVESRDIPSPVITSYSIHYTKLYDAFIGDVVLATPVIEAIKNEMPDSEIDFLLRKGNEALLHNNPKLHKLLIWNKKDGKYKNLLKILKQVRKVKYDYIVNLQRFASTGIFTVFSNGKVKIGFKQNPFSFGFTHKIEHIIGDYTHETRITSYNVCYTKLLRCVQHPFLLQRMRIYEVDQFYLFQFSYRR